MKMEQNVETAIYAAVITAIEEAVIEPEFVKACEEAYRAEMKRRTDATMAEIFGSAK